MRFQDLILDPFADEDGVLRRGHLDGLSAIWVPPHAELAAVVVGERRVTIVVYPMPEAFNAGAENRFVSDPELSSGLEEAGWTVRALANTDSLVQDFVALSEGTDEDVRSFCEEYGPLFVCSRHRHFWTPLTPENIDTNNPDPNAFCLWLPREEVQLFRTHARQLKASLDIAGRLTDPKSKGAPAVYYERLLGRGSRLSIADWPKSQQREFLATVMSGYILQWVSLWVSWKKGPRPQLTLQTGLGFLGWAWLQTAQLIAGGVEMRKCSGCHHSYFRTERRPHKGWNNFCPKCRHGDARKISKMLSARKRRLEQRKAKASSSSGTTAKRRE